MDNFSAVRSLCNAICNTFFPDASAIEIALFNEGLYPTEVANPRDQKVFRIALALVMGYVESSHSEGGVSSSVMSEDAIKRSIAYWCNIYGLDAEEELQDYIRKVEGGSNLW